MTHASTKQTDTPVGRAFDRRVVDCRACPRLRDWCERVAREKVRRHAAEEYWGRPVPSFGPIDARFVVVGLAPAAHGANRTGRLFTGDRSGEWLFRALFAQGFCSREASVSRDDGMMLIDTRITAVAHCAPPGNTLTRDEMARCTRFLEEEFELLARKRVVVALGRVAFDAVRALLPPDEPAAFAHGASYRAADEITVRASYHPSQQNTFTGRLTRPQFDAVFAAARRELDDKSYIGDP